MGSRPDDIVQSKLHSSQYEMARSFRDVGHRYTGTESRFSILRTASAYPDRTKWEKTCRHLVTLATIDAAGVFRAKAPTSAQRETALPALSADVASVFLMQH